MGRLKYITLKGQVDERKPQEHVLAAIGRRQGDQLQTLANRHGVVTRAIQNWLKRFAEQPIEQAPYDGPRPSGPAKIST